ncbi:Uncharacterized protein XB16_2101 [Leptospira santarosai]|uniref:Uncharacterized protein n=1 Tax=Leptospira santarosai TaxID=28183 RepID=A0A2P1QU47_9LEPT|nr:Uncharacterized protein XB16_2101 [Leptospira santarosai]
MKFILRTFTLFSILCYSNCRKPDYSQEMILQEKIDFMNDCNTILGVLGNIREFRKKSSDGPLQDTIKSNQIKIQQKKLLRIWTGKRIFLKGAELVQLPRRIKNVDPNCDSGKLLAAEYTVTHPLSGLKGVHILQNKNSPRSFLEIRIFRLLKNADLHIGEIRQRGPLESKIKCVHYDGGQNKNRSAFESVHVVVE